MCMIFVPLKFPHIFQTLKVKSYEMKMMNDEYSDYSMWILTKTIKKSRSVQKLVKYL